MIVDRIEELSALDEEYRRPEASLVVVYGRRRVGKTELLSEFIKGKRALYFLATEESIVENLEVLDAFKNKVDVTKLIDEQGNTTVTVMAKENVTMPELKLYRAIYKGNKLLGTLEEMKPNMVGGNSVFIFAPLTLKDGESSKIMLWDKKNAPTINAIINQ